MANATPDLRLPSQPRGITALWPVPSYTAWWQRHMCVNNLPKVVTRQCPGAYSNLGPRVTSGLQVRHVTVRLPSHNGNENFKVIQNPGFLPDCPQNWITCSLCHARYTLKISERSVHNFSSYLANTQTNRQTDRQTDKQTKSGKNITSLAEIIMSLLIDQKRARIALYGKSISELWSVKCQMGSSSVTWHRWMCSA